MPEDIFLYINGFFVTFVGMLVQLRAIQKTMMHLTTGHWLSRHIIIGLLLYPIVLRCVGVRRRLKNYGNRQQKNMRKPFSLTGTAHSKTPYRLVHNGPAADRYADRSLSGGTAKIDSRQSIEGETDRRRSIEGEKGKKKKRRRRKKTIHTSFPRAVLARMSSLPTHCPRPRVAPMPSSPTDDSHARRKIEGPLTTGGLLCRYYILQFRAAIQLQFDFHRAIYNLGTVLVYHSALRLVRSMLPLPYFKVGYLTAQPAHIPIAPHKDWQRSQFVLNHEGLQKVRLQAIVLNKEIMRI
ncbi:hypothetical protein B296_00011471 [Ensete ventricosum]|uniref:Uncharacterized protein n=1 Tax=Ensete ventricosum TaxID=4639 RepID=A0A427B6N9_ENSVE|nr:hypothetical protein B296_00011471 [Ensete ventricosum]